MSVPNYLLLDFDGVLHLPGQLPFEHLKLLEKALAPYPALKIVVSSSWQEVHSRENIVEFLGPLANRFAGMTSEAIPDQEFSKAEQAAEDARRLPVIERLQNWPIHRFLRPPGLRQREIEHWMRQCAAPAATWLAVDDDEWNFDEGCRSVVIVKLEKNSPADEFEKLKRTIGNPESVQPVEHWAYEWWRLVVSVPVSPGGYDGTREMVKFEDVPEDLRADLEKMLWGRNMSRDGPWLADWCEFLVHHLVNLKKRSFLSRFPSSE